MERLSDSNIRVNPVGPKKCLIVLCGEAPGKTEVLTGVPFSGTSGNILNQKLHVVGITRQSCYITNVVKVRPPDNDFSIYWKGRSATPELHQWAKELKEELCDVETNVVVALGANALWALTGISSIGKWRGTVLPCTLPNNKVIKVVGTYHPSAVLRDWRLGTIMQLDLEKAKREAATPSIVYPERHLLIKPTYNDLITAIQSMIGKPITYDIETSPGAINCIGLASSPMSSICVPTTHVYWGNKLKPVLSCVHDLLTTSPETIGHNIMFDIQYLCRFFGILPSKPWFDTMVAFHSCYCELPKSLAFLTSIYTNEPYYKDDLKMWNTGTTTDETLWTYNAKDAAVTYEIYMKMKEELVSTGAKQTYDFTMELLEPLIFMMLRGVRVDKEVQRMHLQHQQDKINNLLSSIKEKFGDINPFSPKQVKDALYGKLKVKPIVRKGVETTSKEAIKKLSKSSADAALIADVRSAQTVLSNYCNIALDAIDGRLRCSFNPTGTETRRLSSSSSVFGSGRNLQNFPKWMRDMVVPDEGMMFTEADLSGAESRVVAYLSGDLIGIKAFESGENIHKKTASIVFNMSEEEVELDKKKCEEEERETHSKYFMAKKLRHSIEKGGTWFTVAEQLNISAAEAKKLVELFYRMNPNLQRWFRDIDKQLRANRTIVTPFGDRRIFFGHLGTQMLKDAAAHIAQDVVGKIINTIIKRLYYGICAERKDVEVLLQVHDSVLLQHLPESKDAVYNALVEASNVKVPYSGGYFTIPLTIKSGKDWRNLE